MNKLFEEKSIKEEKGKLKKILTILEKLPKYDPKWTKLNDERKKIEAELYKVGLKRIQFNKEWYYLNKKDIARQNKLKDLSYKPGKDDNKLIKLPNKGNGKVVKFDKYKKDDTPKSELPPIKNVLGKDKQKFRFLPNKEYDVYDIVNIITPNAKFKSIYMGMEGTDVQDILDKLNPQFEKADPFDGVFVLFSDNLPKSFIKKGVRIFLLNEYNVGKGVQLVKAYTNNGKFITKYKVIINSIDLLKKQEVPSKIAASLRVPIGPSLLEKINSDEFQEFINESNETLHFNDFNTDIDFEEINEENYARFFPSGDYGVDIDDEENELSSDDEEFDDEDEINE